VDGGYMSNIKVCMITGCAGFIGSHLTKKCLEMGWFVYGVDKLSYCSYPDLMDEFEKEYPRQFKFDHKDINDIKHLPELDIVFNICAESHVDNSIEDSDEFLRSNINGVHNLLEIIRHKKIRPLFYQMSTDEIYGDVMSGQSHIETDNYNPSNPYSFSKASADLLVKSFARTYGIKYKIGRATNTWGIRQNTEKLIPKTCKNLLLGKPIPLHNYGTPVRTWLHVNDCVNGILTIVKNGKENEIYNIGGNMELPNYKIVAEITKLFNKEDDFSYNIENALPHNFKPSIDALIGFPNSEICDFSYSRDGQDVRYSLDDTKLKALGWKPTCDFDTELRLVVDYYKDNFIW
jgi:dTDP-glucose 4,6-dehydratase